jgi:hypothetical protein
MVVVRLRNGRRCDRIQLAFVVHSIALSSLKVWVCLYVRYGQCYDRRRCEQLPPSNSNSISKFGCFVCDFVLGSSLVDAKAKVRIRSKGAGGVEPIRSSPFNGYT